VNGITLGRLLRLWDEATGQHSTIPPELANRSVTARFSSVPVSDAVRKIFDTLPFDYVFIEDQGIIVTAVSQEVASPNPPATADAGEAEAQQVSDDVSEKADKEAPPEQVRQKPTPPPPPPIPTPFGPIPPSAVNNGFVQLPPVWGQAPGPPFFNPVPMLPPPAGAVNGPVQNDLFAPISIHQ
jgi:hypothetical protein